MSRTDAPSSADPDGVSAQVDLINVPWLMIGEEPSAAPTRGFRAVRPLNDLQLR
jgi:hypothetical protein